LLCYFGKFFVFEIFRQVGIGGRWGEDREIAFKKFWGYNFFIMSDLNEKDNKQGRFWGIHFVCTNCNEFRWRMEEREYSYAAENMPRLLMNYSKMLILVFKKILFKKA